METPRGEMSDPASPDCITDVASATTSGSSITRQPISLYILHCWQYPAHCAVCIDCKSWLISSLLNVDGDHNYYSSPGASRAESGLRNVNNNLLCCLPSPGQSGQTSPLYLLISSSINISLAGPAPPPLNIYNHVACTHSQMA